MLIISATSRSVLDHPEQILYNPRSAGPLAQWLEQATHNRLVAGSNPAGATKFSEYIHTLKPPFTVAFLFSEFVIGSKIERSRRFEGKPNPRRSNHLREN